MNRTRILLILIFSVAAESLFSQKADSTKQPFHLKGAVTVTNKGISFIPSFSLGKPAAIFDLSMGRKRLYFEPQLRFSMEARPWSFLFWWRYKLLMNKKAAITLGAHPALNFRQENYTVNGAVNKVMVTRRYLAGELAQNYFLSRHISAGIYYLYSRGIDKGTISNTHFITLNSNISGVKLSRGISCRLTPQLYYLAQDQWDGFFVTASLSVFKNNCPVSVQSIVNKTIRSNIPGSSNFLWNVSLVYSFSKNYIQK